MKKIFTLVASLLIPCVAHAATYNLFSPANGVLKGSTSTYITTAATSSDIRSMWTGTCNSSSFLRGDGACAAAGATPAGSDTQVQFNNSGAFGASPYFLWDNVNNVLTLSNSSGFGAIQSGTNGLLTLYGGDSNDANASVLSLQNLGGGGGGSISIIGGPAIVPGDGGGIVIAGGDGLTSGNGGGVAITTGTKGASGFNGNFSVSTGPNQRFVIDSNGSWLLGSSGAAGTAGQVLTSNGLTVEPTWQSVSSGGVTSVALTVPSGLSVSGSPITTSGTFGITTSLSGVLKGNGSGFTTAGSSDVIGLWSGTCSSSSFLRGDGTCSADGSSFTSLNGSNISSGTVADARLSGNIAKHDTSNVFSIISSSVTVPVQMQNINSGSSAGVRFSASNDSSQALSLGINSSTNVTPFFTNGPTTVASAHFGTNSTSDLSIGTNGVERLRIASGGAVTINAPTSGTGLTINATSGSTAALNISTGTLQVAGSAGTSGNVLTSNGSSAAPSWQAGATTTTGTFTCTWSGMTTTVSGTCAWTKTGNTVTLFSNGNSFVGVSNTTSMSITSLPVAIRPTHDVGTIVGGICNNGSCFNMAYATIALPTFDTVEVGLCLSSTNCAGGNYTASGSKGEDGFFSMTYPIN